MGRRLTLTRDDGTGAWREWDGEPTVDDLKRFLDDLDPRARVDMLTWEETE